MNTFWLKVAGVAAGVVVVIVLVNAFLPSGDKPAPPPAPRQKTFDDVVREDKQKYLTPPKPVSPNEQLVQQTNTGDSTGTVSPRPKPPETITLYFSELTEIDAIEAQRYLNVAVPGRGIGRLPITGFKLMVDNCRRIITRWPDSWYAYRATQMLADMPERFHGRYNIREEELDLSRFAEPRPGTKPFTVENTNR